MSKSRRNKNKHPADTRKGGGHAPAGKQASVPADETAVDAGVQADTSDTVGLAASTLAASTEAQAGEIFEQAEASTADLQVHAPEIADSEALDEIAVAERADDTAAESVAIAVDAPAAAAATDAADGSAPLAEPADRGGRRGKRHDKRHDRHATTEAPATTGDLVLPAEPRAPAMAQLSEYERLSLAHVAGTPQQSDAPGHWRGVGFRLGARRLAAGFDEVVEILSMPQVTHVPGAQPWMLGVANVRGTLLPVVDLKQFLEGERTVIHEAQRIMVVRQSGGNVAVLIDELYGQRSFNDAQVISVEDETGRYGYFVKQTYRVGDFDWGVFSMSTLARTPEFRQAAA